MAATLSDRRGAITFDDLWRDYQSMLAYQRKAAANRWRHNRRLAFKSHTWDPVSRSCLLCRMAASAPWGLHFFRGWADAGVELRLGRFLLAVSWDYDPSARVIDRLSYGPPETSYRHRAAEECERKGT